jgi:hypothetical protein
VTDETYEELESLRPHLSFPEATALDLLRYKGMWWTEENQRGLDACIEQAKRFGYGRAAAWIVMERAMLGGKG